jgi:hypothetical protein
MNAIATAALFDLNATPEEISVPSISGAAMLVELSISTWSGRKLDRAASRDITSRNNAKESAARVNKKLMGDCEELEAIIKFAANTRTLHYSMTVPWSDSGLRIVTTDRYFKYVESITTCETEYHRLTVQFLQAYEWEIAEAQVDLQNLFNRDDYPTLSALAHKFKFRMNAMPLPEVGDFRVDMSSKALALVKEQYKKFYSEQISNAMQHVWKNTYKVLANMSERLDYVGREDRKKFHDTLVDNVREQLDMLKSYNLTGDMQMTAQTNALEEALLGVTPDALREDDYLRRQTKMKVDAVLKTLPSLDM